jgi:hypothetical protein
MVTLISLSLLCFGFFFFLLCFDFVKRKKKKIFYVLNLFPNILFYQFNGNYGADPNLHKIS